MSPTTITRTLACLLALPLLLTGASSAASGQDGAAEPDGTRPCFIEPPRWNTALDGPMPRCDREVSDD